MARCRCSWWRTGGRGSPLPPPRVHTCRQGGHALLMTDGARLCQSRNMCRRRLLQNALVRRELMSPTAHIYRTWLGVEVTTRQLRGLTQVSAAARGGHVCMCMCTACACLRPHSTLCVWTQHDIQGQVVASRVPTGCNACRKGGTAREEQGNWGSGERGMGHGEGAWGGLRTNRAAARSRRHLNTRRCPHASALMMRASFNLFMSNAMRLLDQDKEQVCRPGRGTQSTSRWLQPPV